MTCPNCGETNISVERVEDMREATCNVCGYFWLIDDDGAIWIPDTAARDDDGDGDEDDSEAVNPYLLTGEELARAERAAKAGRP